MSNLALPSGCVRVGTWNVQYARGAEKNQRRLAAIAERDVDIWVLTETHDDLALPTAYEAVSTDFRYGPHNGGRWTTIWSRCEIVEHITTVDTSRTVCVRLVTGDGLSVVVYGTVLPWHADGSYDDPPKANWSEFYRVVEEQAAEWRALRQRFPDSMLVVAGDLNHNLGGKHYYGTNKGRSQLRDALASADLTCLTETERIPVGQLEYPPIDHICAAPPARRVVPTDAEGWSKTTPDGLVLSDYSGVAVTIGIE